MGVTWCVICHFSLVAFTILSFSFIFVSMITLRLGVFHLGLSYLGLCFLDLVDYFLAHVREVFNYYLSPNIFSGPFSLSSLWDVYNVNVGALNVVPEVS